MQDTSLIQQEILSLLDINRIVYQRHVHQPAFSIEDCLRMPFIGKEITICKNILLCNRQQTEYFLMLLCPQTPFRTAVVSKALGVSRLSFAPKEALIKLLHVQAGSVSPLGLLYDTGRRITLCYEKAVQHTPCIAFHPCDNTATLVFEQHVFWQEVLPLLGVIPILLEIE